MLAASAGHQPVVESLLSSGASANILTHTGKTAAILALEGGHRPIGELIMHSVAKARPSLEAFRKEIDRCFYPHMGHEFSVVRRPRGDSDARDGKQVTSALRIRGASNSRTGEAQLDRADSRLPRMP